MGTRIGIGGWVEIWIKYLKLGIDSKLGIRIGDLDQIGSEDWGLRIETRD